MTLTIEGKRIDSTTADILRHLDNADDDEDVTTSDLREALGLDRSEPIKYRVRTKLMPIGFAELVAQGTDDTGRNLPHRVEFNEKGERYLETHGYEIRESVSDEDLQERVERLERQNDRLWEYVNMFKQDIMELRDE